MIQVMIPYSNTKERENAKEIVTFKYNLPF